MLRERKAAPTAAAQRRVAFALAREGKVNEKGLANPVRMAQMGRTYDVYLAGPPLALQRPLFAALDLVGRVLGYPRMPV